MDQHYVPDRPLNPPEPFDRFSDDEIDERRAGMIADRLESHEGVDLVIEALGNADDCEALGAYIAEQVANLHHKGMTCDEAEVGRRVCALVNDYMHSVVTESDAIDAMAGYEL